jgi:hypothetical protein
VRAARKAHSHANDGNGLHACLNILRWQSHGENCCRGIKVRQLQQDQRSEDKAKEIASDNNGSERKAFAHPHHYLTQFELDFTVSQAA